MDKREFREYCRRAVLNFKRSNDWKAATDQLNNSLLIETGKYFGNFVNKTVAFYVADHLEVSLNSFFYTFRILNGNVAVPIIHNGHLEFALLKKNARLMQNKMMQEFNSNIHERILDSSEIDVFVVPCLGIISGEKRLGRGGGFYDMYFQFNKPQVPILSVLFTADQINLNVESEAHDLHCTGILHIN